MTDATPEARALSGPELLPVVTAVVIAALAMYLRTAGFEFAYDDHQHIEWNAFLHDLGNASRLLPWNYFDLHDVVDQNRPLLIASLFLDRALGGETPALYHLQSVVWHTLTCVLVLLLALHLGFRRWTAAAGAIVFAIHPINAEAVAGISNREDLLATFFALAALLCARPVLQSGRWVWALGVAGAFLLALTAKESAVVTPALLLLIVVCFPSWRPTRDRGRRAAMVLGLAFVTVAGGWAYVESRLGYPSLVPGAGGTGLERSSENGAPQAATSVVRADMAFGLLALGEEIAEPEAGKRRPHDLSFIHGVPVEAWRFVQLIAPVGLSAVYDVAPFKAGWAIAAGFVALFLMGWGAVTAFRRGAPPLAFGLGWFGLATGPVAVVPLLLNPLADRYLYLPSVGFCMALAWLFLDWLPRRSAAVARAGRISGVALAILFTVLGVQQVGQWKDDLGVFTNAVAHAPRNAMAYQNLGLACIQRGDEEGARAAWARAAELDPHLLVAHYNLGRLSEQQGLPEEAVDHYRRATRTSPIVSERGLYDQALGRLQFLEGQGIGRPSP